MFSEAPRVKVHNTDTGKPLEPKFEVLPRVPRLLIVGPSASGKTQLMTSMIENMYVDKHGKSIYSRIYIFSPSVFIDGAWSRIRDFIRSNLRVDETKEPCCFDKWDPEKLTEIFATQRKVIQLQKQQKAKRYFQILVLLDDLADSRAAMHSNKLIEAFLRGRHIHVHTWVSVQKYRALDNAIRVNATDLILFRLRSSIELDAIMEENDNVVGNRELREMYRIAVNDEPYSFLYLKLVEKDPEKFAWLRFERPLYDDVFGYNDDHYFDDYMDDPQTQAPQASSHVAVSTSGSRQIRR